MSLRQLGLIIPGAVALLYGAAGLIALGAVVPLLQAAAGSWAGVVVERNLFWTWPAADPIAFRAHFAARPWLPWLALTAGAVLLSLATMSGIDGRESLSSADQAGRSRRGQSQSMAVAVLVGLLVVMGLAAYMRIAPMTPQDRALVYRPYEDEGVYVTAAQLARQGAVPYRDFFFAHPPLGAYAFLPSVSYHYTAWGSPTSFVMARYSSIAAGLATVLVVFLIGWRLGSRAGGLAAATVYALDGIAIEVSQKALLDPAMVLLSTLSLLFYVQARRSMRGGGTVWLALAGVTAALAFLTKVAAIAVLAAFVVDLLLQRQIRDVLRLIATSAVTFVVVSVYFLVKAPGQYISDVFLFQLVRPADGLIEAADRARDMVETDATHLALFGGAVGAVILATALGTGRFRQWRVVLILATLTAVVLFTSRSYYSHYYSQFVLPLSLLAGGGVAVIGYLLGARVGLQARAGMLFGAGAIGLLVFLSPALIAQVQWSLRPHRDIIYSVVGKYLNYNLPPTGTVLALDPQFSFQAARAPSRGPDGTFLLDSYGYMIYVGLGLRDGDPGAFLDALRRPRDREDVWDVMWQPTPQSDVLARMEKADLVVIDAKSWNRLTDETKQKLGDKAELVVEQSRYFIYRVKKGG